MIDLRTHLINVRKGQDYAFLAFISYFLDETKRDRGFQLYQRLTAYPQSPAPDGRELRAMDFAAHASSDPSLSDEEVITELLRQAYGPEATFDFKTVPRP